MENLQNGDGKTNGISNQLKNLKVESPNPEEHPQHGESPHQSNDAIQENGEIDDECSDDSDETSSEDEPIRAPIELLGEFLLYVRQGKWEDAKKLCGMILIYEPENQEALTFQPLIDEKIQIEKELAEMSEDESSSDEETSDEEEEEEQEEEQEENKDDDDKENEEDGDDDDKEDKTKHLKNKLLFSHNNDENNVWKP